MQRANRLWNARPRVKDDRGNGYHDSAGYSPRIFLEASQLSAHLQYLATAEGRDFHSHALLGQPCQLHLVGWLPRWTQRVHQIENELHLEDYRAFTCHPISTDADLTRVVDSSKMSPWLRVLWQPAQCRCGCKRGTFRRVWAGLE